MRRILGCILAVLGLVAALAGASYLVAAGGASSSCSGGDPYGLACGAGDAALRMYLQQVGLGLLLGGLLLGLVPGILLVAWPRRRPEASSAASPAA